VGGQCRRPLEQESNAGVRDAQRELDQALHHLGAPTYRTRSAIAA
jgi:hypothetical protein